MDTHDSAERNAAGLPRRDKTLHMRLLTAELTDAEARVAKLLVSDFPQSALAKAITLAEQSGTSQATVTRLVAKLGYANYPAFQEEVRAELRSRLASPSVRLRAQGSKARRRAAWDCVAASIQADIENLQRTADLVDRGGFDELVTALLRGRGHVYVIGSKKAAPIAENLGLQLRQVRSRVHTLRIGDNLPDQILDVTAADVLIVVEPRRATTLMETLTSWFQDRGALVSVICDEMPASSLARNPIVLTASTRGISMFDSYSAIVSLCNAMLAAVVARTRAGSLVGRIDELEEINTRFGMWAEGTVLSEVGEADAWRTS